MPVLPWGIPLQGPRRELLNGSVRLRLDAKMYAGILSKIALSYCDTSLKKMKLLCTTWLFVMERS